MNSRTQSPIGSPIDECNERPFFHSQSPVVLHGLVRVVAELVVVVDGVGGGVGVAIERPLGRGHEVVLADLVELDPYIALGEVGLLGLGVEAVSFEKAGRPRSSYTYVSDIDRTLLVNLGFGLTKSRFLKISANIIDMKRCALL